MEVFLKGLKEILIVEHIKVMSLLKVHISRLLYSQNSLINRLQVINLIIVDNLVIIPLVINKFIM